VHLFQQLSLIQLLGGLALVCLAAMWQLKLGPFAPKGRGPSGPAPANVPSPDGTDPSNLRQELLIDLNSVAARALEKQDFKSWETVHGTMLTIVGLNEAADKLVESK